MKCKKLPTVKTQKRASSFLKKMRRERELEKTLKRDTGESESFAKGSPYLGNWMETNRDKIQMRYKKVHVVCWEKAKE